MKIRIPALLTAIIIALSLLTVPASAENENGERINSSIAQFLDNEGEIIGVSSRGEWDSCPENTLEAIARAAETDIDFVAVDVKRTLCGTLILFADDTTQRMLDSEDIFTVAETDYSILSAYALKNSCGGSNERVTEYSIPTLEQALECAVKNDIPLILRCKADLIPEVTNELIRLDSLNTCLVMTDGSKKEISAALSECEEKPYIIGSKKGNVIFNMTSYAGFLEEIEAAGIQLNTVNRYGINFYPSVVEGFSEKMRVICDVTTPEISGFREDSETWWNDLISRGYSVIITDHAELFSEYKERTSQARERLQSLYDKFVTNHTLPDFKDEILSDIKKAYTDAVANARTLLDDSSASYKDLSDGYSKLFKAANDVNKNFSALEDGSAGTTISVPRIILCAAALAAVIIVQIYFFKRRRKDA